MFFKKKNAFGRRQFPVKIRDAFEGFHLTLHEGAGKVKSRRKETSSRRLMPFHYFAWLHAMVHLLWWHCFLSFSEFEIWKTSLVWLLAPMSAVQQVQMIAVVSEQGWQSTDVLPRLMGLQWHTTDGGLNVPCTWNTLMEWGLWERSIIIMNKRNIFCK